MPKIVIYIDGNNLYRAAKGLDYIIDYKKFAVWLRQKYNSTNIYLFIGFLVTNEGFYAHLRECGIHLIFKETIFVEGKIKGNCDAELVLKVVSDFYTKNFDTCVIISGDGDFGCLVEFLVQRFALHSLVAPDKDKCSRLLRNKNPITLFLNKHYYKFSSSIKLKDK